MSKKKAGDCIDKSVDTGANPWPRKGTCPNCKVETEFRPQYHYEINHIVVCGRCEHTFGENSVWADVK